ncbi:MAG: VOC family protein [Chryseolinea sp.]
MTTVNPYLSFKGNCEEAFNFYKSIFGGDFQYVGRYKDAPVADQKNFASEGADKIMHISLPISEQTILMGCDSMEAFGQTTLVGSNISLTITTDSKLKADQIFKGLSAGGKIKMEMNETFWGAYFGMFTDKYGIHWMINFESQGK